MSRPDDYDYYVRREREERRMAATAGDSCVRRIHARFADEYARRARQSGRPTIEDANLGHLESMPA